MVFAERQAAAEEKLNQGAEPTPPAKKPVTEKSVAMGSGLKPETPSTGSVNQSETMDVKDMKTTDRISHIETTMTEFQTMFMGEVQKIHQALFNLQSHNMQIQEAVMTLESRQSRTEAEMTAHKGFTLEPPSHQG